MKFMIKVVTGPEAEKVKDREGWYPIVDGGDELVLGDGAYAKFPYRSEGTIKKNNSKDRKKL